MNSMQWPKSPEDDDSSDDSLFTAAATSSPPAANLASSAFISDHFFQEPSTSPTASFPSQTGSFPSPSGSLPSQTGSFPSQTGSLARSRQSFFAQPSLLSSESDSGSDDELFGVPSTSEATRRHSKPRKVVGNKTTFLLGGKLGEGAYATVKEGIDEKTLKIVAVKVLDLRRLRKMRGGAEAIEREVKVQKRLKRHPNLIELIDVVRAREKNKMYIILEMANGCTVQELSESAPDKRLPESQVSNLAYQTLKGLQYMHEKGVVHRDIKPSNMMLTASGVVKISDFGVAEFLNEYEGEDEVSRTSGSPAFQAPEIARGDLGYSGMKVDVWALGVTIFLLVTGGIPFEADNLLVLFELIGKGIYEEPEWMSEGCKVVIRKMLQVNWKERVGVDELLKDPWIAKGAADFSAEQRMEKGWLAVPRKEFGILEVVKKMYNMEIEEVKPAAAMATQSPSQHPETQSPGIQPESHPPVKQSGEDVRWQETEGKCTVC